MKDKERKQTGEGGCTGHRLCRITPPKRLICVDSSDLRGMADGRYTFFKSKISLYVYGLNQVT